MNARVFPSGLRLLFLVADFRLDAACELLELFQSLLGLRAPVAVRIQLDGLLVRFDSSRPWSHLDLAADGLINAGVRHHARAQQIPRLRVLGINLRGLLEWLDRLHHAPRLVQADAEVAP